tara:strand:- start:3001 stop:4653 length:1653 start_codon:yes stop_codon:yes gene_type:complete
LINKPFEAIVVGSGATGGIAALTLAEAGVKVLVVESGPKLSPSEALGNEPNKTFQRIYGLLSGSKSKQAQHPGYWKSNPNLYIDERNHPYITPKKRPYIWTQGQQVGGRSLTWGGITLRFSKEDFKASRKDKYGPEWPIEYSDLSPHYSHIEKLLKIHGNKDNLIQLPDGEYLPPLPFTEIERNFIKEVKSKLGYKVIHSRGFDLHPSNKKNKWPKSSSLGSSLKKAISTGNVEILSNHIVEHIVLKSDQEIAKGVVVVNRINGERKELESSLIVLCASTLNTNKILLNSLRSHREDGFLDPSGKLGQGIMDHISICRFFSVPIHKSAKSSNETKNLHLSGAGSFFIPFGSPIQHSYKPDFIRGYGIWGGIDRFGSPKWLESITSKKLGFLIAHGEVLSKSSNKISLSEKYDKWGIPIPLIDCKWSQNELSMSKHMKKTIHEIIESFGGEILSLEKLEGNNLLKTFLNKILALNEGAPPPGYYIHEVGGAPMGDDENDSVVTRNNALWRCRNVLIADGACWPTSSWQSPTLTMMAIARRACLEAIRTRGD